MNIFIVYLHNSNTQSQYIGRQVIIFTKQANMYGSKLYIKKTMNPEKIKILGYDKQKGKSQETKA